MKQKGWNMKDTKYLFCKNCTYPLESNTLLKDRMEKIDLVEIGRHIYYALLDKKYSSIDLCNYCYSFMQAYRYSLSKTERLEYEIMNMKKNKDEVQETIERIKNKIERLSDYINLHGYPQEKGIQEKLKWIKEDMYLRFQKDAIEIVESEETEGRENEITTNK